jgi:hypothetical protein
MSAVFPYLDPELNGARFVDVGDPLFHTISIEPLADDFNAPKT